MIVVLLYSTSGFSQATCSKISSAQNAVIRITTWSCSDGGTYITGSVKIGGTWYVAYDYQL